MINSVSYRLAVRRALHKLAIAIAVATAAMVVSAPSGIAAPAPCVSSLAANQAELDAAIAAFNAERRACHHLITLTADIPLSTSTIPINNNYGMTHAWLIVDGNGFSVEGDDDIQPFSIWSNTVVVIERITITGGDSYADGGGIGNSGTLKLRDSTVSGNRGNYGGGIGNSGTLKLINSTISGNRTHEDGGGIYNTGTLTVQNSTIIDNYTGGPSSGGGIYNTGALTVSFSTASNNDAVITGGAIHNEGGTVTVSNSTFDHNGAGESGGGMSNWSGTVNITNSTLSGNSSFFHSGGGIVNTGTLTLTNSTLSSNSTEDNVGGGISNFGSLTLNNTIIANSANGDCVLQDGGTVAAFFSLIEDSGEDACGLTNGVDGNIVGMDPRLGKLTYNGGPSRTHALLAKSPAIDKGSILLAVDPDGNTLKTDQRGKGYPRILPAHLYYPYKKRVDIGAYEYFKLKLKLRKAR